VNSENRILGTLGRRGWRLKRFWHLSRARDWWRTESSRRLTRGPRQFDLEMDEETEDGLVPTRPPVLPPVERAEPLAPIVPFPPQLAEPELEPPCAGGDPLC
jgi:hypothetical protein